MKPSPEEIAKLAWKLGKYAKLENSLDNELSETGGIFDVLFESCEWDGAELLNLSSDERSFKSHLHVGAFRKLPEETISKRSLPVTAATTPWHNLLDNWSELGESERPQNVVNSALKKLDVPYQVATRILHTVAYMPSSQTGGNPTPVGDSGFTDEELVFQDAAGVPHSIQSLGSGIGVIVPVVVALSTTDTELLSIEEPESHVHPRLQAELGDIVITAASGKRKRTLFIETHSEHLILRILRRIRETTRGKLPERMQAVRPEDVAVLYVEPGDGGSLIREIKIDEHGRIRSEWPKGFFEERLEELF
ncbi:DUF3696 domain-containing protein [bacterium]|nr:DUF3696 domain-containing protein [bacterium]